MSNDAPQVPSEKSLYTLLGTIILVVVVSVLGAHATYSYLSQRDRMIQEMTEYSTLSIATLQQNIAPLMQAYAVNEYENLVATEISLRKHFAIVVTNNLLGNVLGEGAYVSGKIRDAAGDVIDFKKAEHAHWLEKEYENSAPITDAAGNRLGSVAVFISNKKMKEQLWEGFIQQLLYALAIAFLLIVPLLWAIHRRLLRPLAEIARVVGEVDRDGVPIAPIPSYRYREINVLTDAMRQMVRVIEASRDSLHREGSRLQSVLEGTNVGTWEWNVQTGETLFNERWAEIVGYTLAELEPISFNTWLSLLHPDDHEISGKCLEAHFSDPASYYDCEVRMRHKDGHWVWVQDRGKVAVWDGDGKPLIMSGTHQDISRRKQTEEQLQNSWSRLQTLLDTASDGIHTLDENGNVAEFSQSFFRMLGYSREETAQLHVADLVPSVSRAELVEQVRALIKHPAIFETRYRRKDGSTFDVEINAKGIVLGGKEYLYASSRDITGRKEAERKLRIAASVFSNSLEGIVVTSPNNEILKVNPAFTRLTGYRPEEVLGKNPRILASKRHPVSFYEAMWESINTNGFWRGEVWNKKKNGDLYAEILSISAVRDESGELQHYIAAFTDISEQKALEMQLDQIAYYDALTGVPNRRLLADRMSQALARARRSGLFLAVCYLDLDGFKPINDTYGHKAGDELLVEIARRLQGELRDTDTLARVGGDEFVMLLAELPFANTAEEILQRVLAALNRPIEIGDASVSVSASIGVALYPPHGQDADLLLQHADQAMYQAKNSGKNRCAFFDSSFAGA